MTYLIHPTSSPISQEYGAEFYWFNGASYPSGVYRQYFGMAHGHNGIDYATPMGTRVNAAAAGTVIHAGLGSAWHNTVGGGSVTVVIDHGDILTAYLHLAANGLKVSKGQKVSQGQYIADSGNTGQSTAPHLHFQVMPKPFKPADGYWGCRNPRNYMTLPPTKRVTVKGGANIRSTPEVNGKKLGVLEGAQVFTVKGYVKGETVNGSNIWFRTNADYYVHLSGAVSKSLSGLKDLTPRKYAVKQGANVRDTAEKAGKIVNVLKPGQSFTIIGWVKGDTVSGSDVWFKSTSGNYVHSSAVTKPYISDLLKLSK